MRVMMRRFSEGGGVDTLYKTNVTGLSVQAFVCLQTRRTAKPEELHRASSVMADFLAGYVHTDSHLGALALQNHANFHATRQLLEAVRRHAPPAADTHTLGGARSGALRDRARPQLEASATTSDDHLQVVYNANGRGLALRRTVIAPVVEFRPFIMQDKDRAEARAVGNRYGRAWLTFFLCSFHVFSAMLEYITTVIGVRDGSMLLGLLFLFKYIARAQTLGEARRRWTSVAKPAIQALDCGLHTVRSAGADALVTPRTTSIIRYFEANWMATFWLAAWTDVARTLAGLLGAAQTNNNTERNFLDYILYVCGFTMFNNVDDEINHITGCYNSLK
jgi:hypothetical protein